MAEGNTGAAASPRAGGAAGGPARASVVGPPSRVRSSRQFERVTASAFRRERHEARAELSLRSGEWVMEPAVRGRLRHQDPRGPGGSGILGALLAEELLDLSHQVRRPRQLVRLRSRRYLLAFVLGALGLEPA